MIDKLQVLINGKMVGHLAQQHGRIAFQYTENWLSTGFDLAPASLPFDGLANMPHSRVFEGLHGVFNDSLPDGWGLLLMDRALKQFEGLDPHQITPLDRLAYTGQRAMGALEYQPELLAVQDGLQVDLAEIAAQSERVLKGETTEILETLRLCGGSPGGARPKVTVAFSDNMECCTSNFGELPVGFAHWIVKFRNDSRYSDGDPVDIGRLEMAYADMARQAGIEMPKTALLEVKVNRKREAFFAVQRFDRVQSRKIHFLSLAGYAYANHREPCLDYSSGVLAATKKLTRSDSELEKAFRLMLFNVLTHNKDDHSKNFAYLFDESKGRWALAPGFDLTFSHGMANSHTTSINGAGNPTFNDIKAVAKQRGIANWLSVLDEVRSAVGKWPEFASNYGMSKARIAHLGKQLRAIDQNCSPRI